MRISPLVGLLLVLPAQAQTTDHYPLRVGTVWHYELDAGGQKDAFVNRIAKIEKIDNKDLALQETVKGGKVLATEHLSSTAAGVFRHRSNNIPIDPPIQLLKYPIKPGESWEVETILGGQKSRVTCKVDGFEDIKVAAGKFKTVAVTVALEMGDGKKVVSAYWFAAGVGVVRQSASFGGNELKLELQKFERGP